jgi:cobalt/nickel transport protein
MSRPRSNRRLFAALLVVALLVAGVASYYASSHPDGLEYVAGKTGFLETAEEDGPSIDSPLADYGTEGVDDERLSGGLAGIAGVALTLAIGGGLFLLLRRRDPADKTGD